MSLSPETSKADALPAEFSLSGLLRLLQANVHREEDELSEKEIRDVILCLKGVCTDGVRESRIRGAVSETLVRRILDRVQTEVGSEIFEVMNAETWDVAAESARRMHNGMTMELTPWRGGVLRGPSGNTYAEVDAVVVVQQTRLALLQISVSHTKTNRDNSASRLRRLENPFVDPPLLPVVMTGSTERAPRIRAASGKPALYLPFLGRIRLATKRLIDAGALALENLTVLSDRDDTE